VAESNEETLGAGFDKAAPDSSSTISPEDIKQAIEDKKQQRAFRETLFKTFLWIPLIYFLAMPVAGFYLITSPIYINEIKTENVKAIIATSTMMAMISAIPFTVFITLAKIVHTENSNTEKKDDKKIETSITSLITSISDICDKLKSIIKK